MLLKILANVSLEQCPYNKGSYKKERVRVKYSLNGNRTEQPVTTDEQSPKDDMEQKCHRNPT